MFRSRVVAVLVTAALLGGCAALGGCTAVTGTPHVSILGPWPDGGAEAAQFRAALTAFEQVNDVIVDYTGSRTVAEVLRSAVQQSTPPDIAILPSPGDVAVYQSKLTPLDAVVGDDWTGQYSQHWHQLAKVGLPKLYAVPIRANLKGLIWYPSTHPPNPVPQTFDQLVALSGQSAAAGRPPWCLGVSAQATSGWPGTDWIEDILLHRSGIGVYQEWVAGTLPWSSTEVRGAWRAWGSLVTDGERGRNHVLGGQTAALLTDFADAGRPMFGGQPRCLMEHQASFMSAFYSGYDQHPQPGVDFDYFPLPPFPGRAAGVPVSADLAGIFHDTPEAESLIRFLVSTQAQQRWPAVRAFSANAGVPSAEYDPVSRRIAAKLTGDEPLCFDGSDLMPSVMRDAFYRAVLEYLSNPTKLDDLLTTLDRVRTNPSTRPWLDVACGQ